MSSSNVGANADFLNLKTQLEEAIALATSDEAVDRRVFVIAFGEARRLQGFSREQLATETGLSLTHLIRIELGDHAIAPDEIAPLARALQLPPALLKRLGPPERLTLTPLPLPTPVAVPA